MPYADPEKSKEVKRLYYNGRYWKSPKFRKEEAERKAAWYQANKERCDAKTRARRAKVKTAKTKSAKTSRTRKVAA